MRWRGREQSTNIEDRRAMRTGPAVAGGGGLIIVIMVVLGLMMGQDPQQLVQQVQRQRAQQQAQQRGGAQAGGQLETTKQEEELKAFVSVVLKDTEDVWHDLFTRQLGKRYAEPKLVLFRGHVRSACGTASAAVGPFYCPGDDQVYLDMSFFEQLQNQFGAKGDFAMAYVVAHEVAHHVQNQLGISDEVHRRQKSIDKVAANRLSVRLELQADFLSGVWAHHGQKKKAFLEKGDIEEAMNCAAKIGDDMLQKKMQGRVVPDAFTHGTSQQRARWFGLGLKTGDIALANKLFELNYEEI